MTQYITLKYICIFSKCFLQPIQAMEFVTSLKEVFHLSYKLNKAKKFMKNKKENGKNSTPSKRNEGSVRNYKYTDTFLILVIGEETTILPPSYHSVVKEKMVTEVRILTF